MDEKDLEKIAEDIRYIETKGIKSHIMSIGYRLLIGKYNKLAKELNRDLWNPKLIRDGRT